MRTTPRPVVAALVAAIAFLMAPLSPVQPWVPVGPGVVRAATPDLTIVTSARYDVQPDAQRIRVTVDLTLRNRLKDTKTTAYYFDRAFLAILPNTTGHRLTWDGGGTPRVRVTRETKDFTIVRLDLAQRLTSGKTAKYRLRFDLPDPGGAPTRDLRVGDSLVSFPVWSFASEDTPGSSVTVVFPEGYQVKAEVGSLPEPEIADDGRTIYRTGALDDPLEFFIYLVGDRPGAYGSATVATTVLEDPVEVVVRAWSDDEPWEERVTGVLDRALPVLGNSIGLPWPDYDAPLTVREAVSRTTGGYAGLFDPDAGEVEIAYYADDFVVLHEAAHAWFNGSLLGDRWANEAFASYYATEAAGSLDIKVTEAGLDAELEAARIPLNGWGPVGTEESTTEDFAYAASLALADAVADRAGEAGLRAVWSAAAERVGAYQPPDGVGAPETVDGPPDWRGLLDLLEERTDKAYDDLWRTWVARPTDVVLLDARAEARGQYESVVSAAAEWDLPEAIRDALRAWRFDDATTLLEAADEVIDDRAAVASAAADAGLEVPVNLRLAFEDDDGFDDAIAEADAELQAIARIVEASSLRPTEPTPLQALGLWSATPEADLSAAREAFAGGDLAGSVEAADDAGMTWAMAESVGQGRALTIGAGVVGILLALALLIVGLRRRQRRRRRMQASRIRA